MGQEEREWLKAGRAALEIEAGAVAAAAARLGDELIRAVDLIVGHPGKVVVRQVGSRGA
jgi:D-arabinose 5-phosphate isomerase GutQ